MQSNDTSAGFDASAWTWRVDPPAGWLVVPSTETEPPDAVTAWEQEAAAAVRESLEPVPGETAELDDTALAELDQLAVDSVANLRAFADGMAPAGNRVVAAVGVLGNGPVPVLVAVGLSDPADPDGGLMAALGATGGNPATPPNVEHLDLPDGDGVRVVRLDVDEAGTGWMSVAVGRRTEHPDAVVDTVLVWRTVDLFLVAAMVELLDQLLPTVQITRSAR